MEASTALLEAPIPECVHAFSSQVVASPISQNPSFSIEHPASWKPCARQHYGDCCQKIFRLDSYHVLLCGRRLVFMEGNDHFSFPPFDADILDVYAERISGNTLFIVVGLSTGVHLAVVDLREFKVDQTSFQPTASPVVKMYRVKKHLFALCLSNCQVDLMEFAAGIDFIDAMITSKWNGWTNFASKLFNPQLYKDSFFCRRNGYLVVLSTHAISIWMVGTDGKLTLTCSCSVDRNTVAVQRFHLSNLIGFAILRCGGLIPIKLFIGNDTPTLSLGEPAFIPTLTSVAEVSMSCGHNNSIVMYDAGTSSVVIVSECSPMVDDFTAGTLIASQIYLNTQVSGLCFEGTSLGGKFWVYGDESVALCLRQNSTGEIIRQSFEYNISETRRHFIEVLPCKRVELLLEVMTCGFPIKEASSLAYGLFVPEKLTSRSFRLSAGAIGVIFYFLKQIEHLDELCVSFHYWELPKHLFRACDTLRQAIDIASSFLNHGGFLDCPEELSLLWSSDFVAESVGASIADPSCVSGQAIMLQRMLGLARHAATIGWLYGLVLLEGPDHEPSRCLLKKQLADEAFSVTEEVLCTELLSLRSAEVLETMSSHCEDLPPRSRLELQLSKLALAGHGEEALAFSVQHFGDLLKHNLVDYASHLIGHDNPDLLVELRFMLEHCKLDISVSESVIRFLDTIPSSSQLLLRSLRCIFSMASADLQQIVVLWMESHQLSDLRIETFARVISECRIDVPIDRTLTGQFLSSWCEAERGVGESASQHFGELARTPLPLALEARLLCLQHAAAGTDQSDANRLTEFLLLLQQQLAMLIRRHMECDSVLISSRAVLENDVRIAGEHLLDERQLFTTAGRYAELGGGNIQLDILKIHNDSPPDVTSNAVISVLHFMKAMGVRSSDAVERVLKEYLPSFQAPLPLLPFVEFLSSESIDADETSNVLLLGGASSDDMFDCFLGLLDSAGSPLFPITNLVPVMKKLCTQCSRNDRVRSAYLLECIRGMLAGEYHSLMLSEEEVTFLQKEERAMKLK